MISIEARLSIILSKAYQEDWSRLVKYPGYSTDQVNALKHPGAGPRVAQIKYGFCVAGSSPDTDFLQLRVTGLPGSVAPMRC